MEVKNKVFKALAYLDNLGLNEGPCNQLWAILNNESFHEAWRNSWRNTPFLRIFSGKKTSKQQQPNYSIVPIFFIVGTKKYYLRRADGSAIRRTFPFSIQYVPRVIVS